MNQKQLSEYDIIRNKVGIFDLSSTVKFYISGNDGIPFLNKLVGGNVEAMREGKAINTLLMRENGTIIAIVWLLKDGDNFVIFTDPEKRDILLEWLNKHSEGKEIQIEDKTDILGCLSIIGPRAQEVVRLIAGDDIVGLAYLGFEHNVNTESLICRVGYTGEYEYRFILPKEKVDTLRALIREKGNEYGIAECNPDILNVLMLEMKSVNQNLDLLEDTIPVEAGLHWMINFRKDKFIGKDSVTERKKTVSKKLLTLLFENTVEIPEKSDLFIQDTKIGFIVQKSFSPVLNKDIGLAYIDEKFGWVGIDVDVLDVNREIKHAKIVSSPLFITKTVKDASQQ